MKIIGTFVCLLILAANSLFGQVTLEWASTYGRTATSDDQTADFAVDANGNSYITGYSYGTNGDYATVMFNSSGVQQWASVYAANATSDDHPTALAVDPAGNVYVTGYCFSGTNYNYLTVKYNNAGVQQWAVFYNGTGNGTDEARDIAVDAAGNCYVTGQSQGTNANFATVKYNTSGVQQWATTFNGSSNNFDNAIALTIDGSGNTYVTGEMYTGTQYNYATAKYNSTGILLWSAIYNGPGNGEDRPTDITTDVSGNVYVTGHSFNGSTAQFATIKYNSAGAQQWVAFFAATMAHPNALTVDFAGNVYVTGYYYSSNYVSQTVKWNAAGVIQWQHPFSAPGMDFYNTSITTDLSGNIFVGGYWQGYTSAERVNPSNGTRVWAEIYGPGGNTNGIGVGIGLDANNNIYIGTSKQVGTYSDFAIVKYAPVIPLSTTSSQSNVTCNGLCNGSATVVAANGIAPYTYSWSPSGGTSATATNRCAGTYTCTITDNAGSTITQTFSITEPTAVTASATATSISCNGGSSTITVSGSGGISPYTGTGTFVVSAGTYSYTVTDNNGCASSASVTVTEPTTLMASSSATSISCNGGNSTITVIGSGGTAPYSGAGNFVTTAGTYSYTVADNNGCTSSTSITVTEPTVLTSASSATSILCNGGNSTITVSGSGGTSPYTGEGTFVVTAGTYTYTITDANSCTSTTSITITEPTVMTSSSSATSIACNGGSTTVTVAGSGGTSPYTGDGTFIEVAGMYSYTVTDNNGCTSTTSINITEPTVLTSSSSSTSIACNGGTAAVTVAGSGGTSPYTGDGTFNEVAGTYTYTITDANSCTSTTSITVTEPTLLTSSSSATSIACNGGNTTITVNGSGGTSPYTGDGNFTQVAGTYTYTITDANSCTTTTSITVTEPTLLTSSSSATSIACNGGTTTVTVAGSGGTSPYTGEGTFTEFAGTYTYTITDANSCTSTATLTVTEPAVLTVSITSLTDPSTCSGTDGAIDITPAGGTLPYSFLWNNAATSEDLSAVNAGTYSCDITDANGCTTSIGGSLNDPNAPTVTLLLAMDTLCVNDGSFTLSGESPTGGTFSGPGVIGNSFDPATAGIGMHNIAYVYTDVNGCIGNTSDSMFVDVCLDAQTENASQLISIYPNPSNGTVVIKAYTNSVITIHDVNGNLILVKTTTSEQAEIDLSNNAAGVYYVQVCTENRFQTIKLVLTK